MHGEHQSVCSLVDDLQLVLLLLAVFGDVSDAAAGQQELHLRSLVFRGFIALRHVEREREREFEMFSDLFNARGSLFFNAHEEFIVLDDAEQFGPLSEAFLAQEESADSCVLH